MLIRDWRAQLFFGEEEVFVPAKALVNGTTITIDRSMRPVDYFHVLFDRHEIMFTEGAPTESFHPGPYALRELGPDARDELFALFPELAGDGDLGATARPVLRPWEAALLHDGLPAEPPVSDAVRIAS